MGFNFAILELGALLYLSGNLWLEGGTIFIVVGAGARICFFEADVDVRLFRWERG